MTAAEKLQQLMKILPPSQINEVLNFAEFLHQKQHSTQPAPIHSGTLTGLRGIAKRHGTTPTDDEIQAEYTDYLAKKYQ